MGLGDNLMASGMAKGAKDRGKRIAFGDGRKIIWDHHSEIIFRNNPNIVVPGHEGAKDVEWIPFYRGNRQYNRQHGDKWIWNLDFRPTPGEVFLSRDELRHANEQGTGFVLIEPNVPIHKMCGPNKQWGVKRYQAVASELLAKGLDVAQFVGTGPAQLKGARQIPSPTFRHALAVLKNAALYIGPEGGLHHGSAAMGTHAVVLFGGFIPPSVTGYDWHANLTGGAKACGNLRTCNHCRTAMDKITPEQVLKASLSRLSSGT
jgi:hypothetical protein